MSLSTKKSEQEVPPTKSPIMKKILLFISLVSLSHFSYGQFELPYTFTNNSIYDDTEIYIGLVGKFGDNVDVWMDMNDYSLVPMSADQNTLDGPPWSTPVEWKYPDIFTQLSNITDNTIQIPQGLYGSRIFISLQSPMFLHFHETGGYAGANLNSTSDPNDGIRWEIVELTWGNSGLWTNSSRVDAYQYPISVEVSGFSGGLVESSYTESYLNALGGNGSPKYGKIGEQISHEDILTQWDNTVSEEYLVAKVIKENSIDGGYIIEQPSKVEGFPDDILDEYIDDIWSTYARNDLVIDIGDRGIWTGRVTGERFDFVDPADGSIATIYGKPTTFNAIEGSGFLASTEVDGNINREKHDEDLMIQAQIAASISRHAIYTDIIDGTVQYTHDASRYFIQSPYNEYVKFFHNEEISYASQTYAFAYDDVGDHSSTIQCTYPTSARVIIGGYNEYVQPSPELALISISPYTVEIEQGENLQYIAQGYDQYSATFPTTIGWSTTGAEIDSNGLFTASTLGQFTITAQDGNISRSVEIKVVESPGVTGCEADSPNGDYNYIASNEIENPTITYIPSVSGNGESLCLLFYKVNQNDNFTDLGVTPGSPQEIIAIAGDTVTFYYTYSLATGGENNTASSPQSFIVGGCQISNVSPSIKTEFEDLSISPNPTHGEATYLLGINEEVSIGLYSIEGTLLQSYSTSTVEKFKLNTSDLVAGMYLISVTSINSHYSKAFKLIVK